MSSGEGRVDVEVESKRADEPTPGHAHPNTCPGCGSHYRDDELEQTLRVCPQCGHHVDVAARERVAQLADDRGGARRLDGVGVERLRLDPPAAEPPPPSAAANNAT